MAVPRAPQRRKSAACDKHLIGVLITTAAFWGRLLTVAAIGQVSHARREIRANRKVVEVCGHLYIGAPKNRKFRPTVYPRRTPAGYPLADHADDRITLDVYVGATAGVLDRARAATE